MTAVGYQRQFAEALRRMDEGKTVMVICGSSTHLDLIRRGYQIHSVDDQIVRMMKATA